MYVYINVSHNKCEMAEDKQVYLFIYVCIYLFVRKKPYPGPDILEFQVDFNTSSALIYRVSQEEWTKHRESVPYVKLYRYNPKHLCPKLNGY